MERQLLAKLLLLISALVGGGSSVWATYKLTKVTSVSAGNKYVFERNSRVLKNTISSNALQTTASYSMTGLAGTEAYVWTLESAKGGYYMKNVSLASKQYLNNSSGTSLSFDSKSSVWSFSFEEDGALISNISNENRFLGDIGAPHSDENQYKAYATSYLNDGGHDFTVYILEEETNVPSLTASDLALTAAPISLTFDLYDNSDAQTIHYTTSSTGAVTVSSSSYVSAVVDSENKTITITPIAATPSPQTITVSQAADATYAQGSVTFSVTVNNSTPAVNPQENAEAAVLPFFWTGGTRTALLSQTGVIASGLGDDYSDDVYKVKFDDAGDYIQIKTSEQPTKVMVGVKMLGGSNTSKIKIQESADGSAFADVEEFTISSSNGTTQIFLTSNAFAATTRYVRIIKSVHPATGGNIGIGPIAIAGATIPITPAKTYTTLTSVFPLDFTGTDIRAFIVLDNDASDGVITMTEVSKVPANTGLVLKAATAGTAIQVPVLSGDADDVAGNKMEGSAIATTTIVANQGYILSDGKFHPATTGTLAAGKAYLNIEVSSQAPVMSFNLSDMTPTGVARIENGEFSLRECGVARRMENYFNLAGQRVTQPSKGLYIVNGQKVIIK